MTPHGIVAFRQMFKAITSELTSCSDLVLNTDHLRKKLHTDSYSQTNDSAISNAFKYHQDSLHINMFAHTPPLTYLKEISTGRWRVTVGIGEEGVMTCANSPFTTPHETIALPEPAQEYLYLRQIEL